MYALDQSVVERIIQEKSLKTRQEIMNFFALNKDKIQSLFQENQIQSIINEEFMDTQNIVFKQIPSIGVTQSQTANQDLLAAYSSFMIEQFPKFSEVFRDVSQNCLVWPKYVGSLQIPVQVSDEQKYSVNQELCLELSDFVLNTKELNQQKKKFAFSVSTNTLYILLYTKKKEYVNFNSRIVEDYFKMILFQIVFAKMLFLLVKRLGRYTIDSSLSGIYCIASDSQIIELLFRNVKAKTAYKSDSMQKIYNNQLSF